MPEPDYVDQTCPDVLTELGRLTLAAVYLEDYARALIWRLVPNAMGALDTAPIGTRIDDAVRVASELDDVILAAQIKAWLTEVKAALGQRNTILHSTPVTYTKVPGVTVVEGTTGEFLHHFPNNPKRAQVQTALTVNGLRPISDRLIRVRGNWRDLTLRLAEHKRSG